MTPISNNLRLCLRGLCVPAQSESNLTTSVQIFNSDWVNPSEVRNLGGISRSGRSGLVFYCSRVSNSSYAVEYNYVPSAYYEDSPVIWAPPEECLSHPDLAFRALVCLGSQGDAPDLDDLQLVPVSAIIRPSFALSSEHVLTEDLPLGLWHLEIQRNGVVFAFLRDSTYAVPLWFFDGNKTLALTQFPAWRAKEKLPRAIRSAVKSEPGEFLEAWHQFLGPSLSIDLLPWAGEPCAGISKNLTS